MAHIHVAELDWLKRLSIIDGNIMFDTGALLQAVSDRIEMYEDMIKQSPETYKEELQRLKDEKVRQQEHLRTM